MTPGDGCRDVLHGLQEPDWVLITAGPVHVARRRRSTVVIWDIINAVLTTVQSAAERILPPPPGLTMRRCARRV